MSTIRVMQFAIAISCVAAAFAAAGANEPVRINSQPRAPAQLRSCVVTPLAANASSKPHFHNKLHIVVKNVGKRPLTGVVVAVFGLNTQGSVITVATAQTGAIAPGGHAGAVAFDEHQGVTGAANEAANWSRIHSFACALLETTTHRGTLWADESVIAKCQSVGGCAP